MANTFENLSDIEDYDDKPWWVDYDGDIEEERRKIIEHVKEINPDERETKYQELLNELEYNEYFAYNTHLKSESYLNNLRNYELKEHENQDISEFIGSILYYTHMIPANCDDEGQNILFVNVNKKFTFLNSIDYTNLYERGLTKMRREYGNEWEEGDEKIYEIVLVRLCM